MVFEHGQVRSDLSTVCRGLSLRLPMHVTSALHVTSASPGLMSQSQEWNDCLLGLVAVIYSFAFFVYLIGVCSDGTCRQVWSVWL